MKIARYEVHGEPRFGFVVDDHVVDASSVEGVTAGSVRELIAGGDLPDAGALAAAGPGTPLDQVRLLPPVDDDYAAFEASFPYDETRDQAAAISEVLADLGSERVMDRLVCGDVGFGKTEVALRAAFWCASSPDAAGMFSTTTGWPSRNETPSAMSRAITSVPAPGPCGTISLIGRFGQAGG